MGPGRGIHEADVPLVGDLRAGMVGIVEAAHRRTRWVRRSMVIADRQSGNGRELRSRPSARSSGRSSNA